MQFRSNLDEPGVHQKEVAPEPGEASYRQVAFYGVATDIGLGFFLPYRRKVAPSPASPQPCSTTAKSRPAP